MSDAFPNRHVLEVRIAASQVKANADHVAVIRHAAIFSVLAHAGHEEWTEEGLKTTADVSLRHVGPGEWVLVSETRTSDSLGRELAALDAGRVSHIEQSDGRVLLRISGPNVRCILAKCVAVDLHPTAFPEGRSANMLCCHVSANVARTGPDSFEIVAMRSYAGFLFEELMEMGREFGLTAGFAD
jgi:heterotetrameric sarcosine oxidase gamma subunit